MRGPARWCRRPGIPRTPPPACRDGFGQCDLRVRAQGAHLHDQLAGAKSAAQQAVRRRGTRPPPLHRRTGWSGRHPRLPPGRAACRPPPARSPPRARGCGSTLMGAWPCLRQPGGHRGAHLSHPGKPDVQWTLSTVVAAYWIVGSTIPSGGTPWKAEAALIGLGIMGGAMSASLVAAPAGTVHGYDPDEAALHARRSAAGGDSSTTTLASLIACGPGDHDQPADPRRPARRRRQPSPPPPPRRTVVAEASTMTLGGQAGASARC